MTDRDDRERLCTGYLRERWNAGRAMECVCQCARCRAVLDVSAMCRAVGRCKLYGRGCHIDTDPDSWTAFCEVCPATNWEYAASHNYQCAPTLRGWTLALREDVFATAPVRVTTDVLLCPACCAELWPVPTPEPAPEQLELFPAVDE